MSMTFEEAVNRLVGLKAAADELAAMPPQGPQFLTRVGQAYTLLGAHDRAAEFLARAAEAAPTNGQAHYNIGAAYIFLGRFEEAKAHLLKAIQYEPRHYPSYYSLTDMEKQTPEANYIPQLEALFEGPDRDGNRTLHVGQSLAKTYEDLGDPEKAFDWLVRGKEIRRKYADYSPVREEALFAAAPATATAGRGRGYEDGAPIFIGGMPRSGTTLVEAILAAHPDVTAGGEPGIIPALVKYIGPGRERHILDAANLVDLADVDLARLGKGYMDAIAPIAGDTPRMTDKTPMNAIYAGVILQALPNAKVICMRRDPMDSVTSFFRTMFFSTSHVYPSVYDLKTAAHHYVRFHRLADKWREILPPDRYREQSYEALVADPEGQTRELLEFTGLDFHPDVLRFHELGNIVSSASASQVRQPIYKTALGRWKRYGKQLQPAIDVLRKAGIEVEDL